MSTWVKYYHFSTDIDKLVLANKCLSKVLANTNTALTHLRIAPSTATGVIPSSPLTNNNRRRPSHCGAVKPEWDLTGYCWTHEFKVKMGHTSHTCSFPKEGHIITATCQDNKGGSKANKGWPTART
jgi:hypothetical protein